MIGSLLPLAITSKGRVETTRMFILSGNPLSCGCNLLWLQAWLQEGSSVGPRCVDGSLLRELRLSRQECPPEDRNSELVAPGCESELLTAPDTFGTSQVFSPWTNLKSNISKEQKNHLAPSPEESEYFYDEYIDYPYNDTHENLTQSPHYTPGDTPTLYAAPKNKTRPDIPKEVVNSPSTSGFTFFGVPLPSLNLKNLLGGNGRMEDTKIPVAERKVAIMNKPRSGARGGLGLPSLPEIQTGGFVPLLPGEGGFKPIVNPHLQDSQASNITFSKVVLTTTETPQISTNSNSKMDNFTTQIPTTTSLSKNFSIMKEEFTKVSEKIEELTTSVIITSTTLETPPQVASTTTELPEIETASVLPEVSSTVVAVKEEAMNKSVATPLSALLAPGGQQPEFRPAGRPIITKVPSPHISGSAPLLSNPSFSEIVQPLSDTGASSTNTEQSTSTDTSWYFANYNKTNLEPFVGVSKSVVNNKGGKMESGVWKIVFALILVNQSFLM